MKKYVIMLVIVLFCTYTMYADAEAGRVEIVMPVEGEFSFTYSKVADIVDGEFVLKEELEDSKVDLNQLGNAKEMQEAICILQSYVTESNVIKTAKDGSLQMSDLAEGVYLVQGASENEYKIPPVLVTIPTIDTETKEMLYDITVMPKIEITSKTVDTSDNNNAGNLSVFFVISLIVVAILSCQKHFKCGRISE